MEVLSCDFFSCMTRLVVLVLITGSKKNLDSWVYHKISLVIKYYLVLIENRYDQIIDGDEHRCQERARREV